MQFSTISAILRGIWLLQPQWAQVNAPLIFRLLEGGTADLGMPGKTTEETDSLVQLSARGYKVSPYTNISKIPEGSIAVVDLVGPVVRYGDYCTYGLEDHAMTLRQLKNAGNIIGAVLNTNTPGGEASGTGMLASVIKDFRAAKPIVGFVEDGIAASAGMWLISQCSEIYASNKQSEFGSIGAYTMLADWLGYYEKEGLKIHEIYAPQSVDKNKDFRDALEGNYAGVQASLSDLVEVFKADVKAGRGGKISATADPYTGKMYDAKESKKIGLIDNYGYSLESTIDRVQQLSKKSNKIQKTTAMAKTSKDYPQLAKTAGWDAGYEVTEDGINLDPDAADAVETSLDQGAKDAAEVVRLTTELKTATDANAVQAEHVRTVTADRDSWKGKAEKFGATSANTGTVTKTEKDDTDKEDKPTSTCAVTAQAMKAYERNRSKAE